MSRTAGRIAATFTDERTLLDAMTVWTLSARETPVIPLTTVYRALRELKTKGLIKIAAVPGDRMYYQIDTGDQDRISLIDAAGQAVTVIDSPEVVEKIQALLAAEGFVLADEIHFRVKRRD